MSNKSRTLAKVPSRLAEHLEYKVGNTLELSGKQPIGGMTVQQTVAHADYPTVQGAIDDLISLSNPPINTVITNTDGLDPTAVSQSQTVTVRVYPGQITTDAIVECFGVRIKVQNADLQEATRLTTVIVRELQSLSDKEQCFKNITHSEGTETFNVTMIDYKDHPTYSYENPGVEITTAVLSPAKPGYMGTWTKIGEENKFDGKLYYFKRIA